MTSEEHDSAVRCLNEALVEQDRLIERYDAASGTVDELGAYVRLRVAADLVAARGAWLSWIDDEGYRGLNAGPFELLAESDRRVGRAIAARSDLASRRVGRAWLAGRELGDTEPASPTSRDPAKPRRIAQPGRARGNGA
jgi:hypothetical protein